MFPFLFRLFDRALEVVETGYMSHTLWDAYIRYEEEQGEWNNLAKIYRRILKNPIKYLDEYFQRLLPFPLALYSCIHVNLSSRDQE